MTDLVPAPPPSTPARRDDTVLPGTAERIRKGVSANTAKAYTEVRKQFEDWCVDHGRLPYPTSAATLADYVAHLCDLGRAPNTVRHHRGVISALNQAEGHPPLGKELTQAARLVQRGHQRERADQGKREKKAPPITRARLVQMSKATDASTLTGKRDRLLLVIGWALAGRRSELAALRVEDITPDPDGEGGLDILIRASKTDQDANGAHVFVPAGEHVDTDPVGLLNDWLTALAERGVDTTTGPLFRAITRHDTLRKERVVVRRDGVVIRFGAFSPDAVNDVVQRAAHRAGLPNAHLYSAHSLRAGFATQAAKDGVPLPEFARHGRWKVDSPVPQGYVRAAAGKRDNPLRKMGL